MSVRRLSLLLGAAALLAPAAAQSAASKRPRVVLIGLDGFDWNVARPLLKAGALPHIAACRAAGASGNLGTFPGTSPSLWTDVATGKPSPQNGIQGFLKDEETSTPFSQADRKVAALWEILSDAGKSVLTVEYLATDPPEPVNGVMVSDRYHERRPGTTYPADLYARLNRMFDERMTKQGGEHDAEALGFPPKGAPSVPGQQALDKALFGPHIGDEHITMTAELLLAQRRYDFFAIHLWSSDSVAHFFGRFSPLDPRPLRADLRRRYGPALDDYYRFLDHATGRLIKAAGAGADVVIMSDHGLKPDLHAPDVDPARAAVSGPALWTHESPAFFVACGPLIRKKARLRRSADLLGVAPTILELEGLPPASDMGRPFDEVLVPSAIVSARVKTYGSGRARGSTTPYSAEVIEHLKAAGYLPR